MDKLDKKTFEEGLKKILSTKPKKHPYTFYCDAESYRKVQSGGDQFNMALLNYIGKKTHDYVCKEFIRRNNMDSQMEKEYLKCKNGTADMTGEEYFFYNYCRINGNLPDPGTYSPEKFQRYLEEAKKIKTIKWRRKSGIKPSLFEKYMTPEDAFYQKIKSKE